MGGGHRVALLDIVGAADDELARKAWESDEFKLEQALAALADIRRRAAQELWGGTAAEPVDSREEPF